MPELTLRVGGYAPRDSTHSAGLAEFAKLVRAESHGRIEVDIMWNVLDEGRPATDLLSMVEAGELGMCYFSTSYLGSRVPDLNVLETPFLFRDLGHAHDALDGDLGTALTVATEQATGFRVLGYWDNGFRHLTNAVRPIHTPEDVRGLRVRLQPNALHEAMVESWGGIPVAVELSRGIEMIRAGEVEAQENPLANTVAYGVDKVHGHATMTGHLYGARGVYAHPDTLDSLGRGDTELIQRAARNAIDHQRNAAVTKERDLRVQLTEAGMRFVDPSEGERTAFIEATRAVQTRARNEIGDRLFDLV